MKENHPLEKPLEKLVTVLKRRGYKHAESIVLRAFKWKRVSKDSWSPPYNGAIMFTTDNALEVCCEPFFLSDAARGRFDGVNNHPVTIWESTD